MNLKILEQAITIAQLNPIMHANKVLTEGIIISFIKISNVFCLPATEPQSNSLKSSALASTHGGCIRIDQRHEV